MGIPLSCSLLPLPLFTTPASPNALILPILAHLGTDRLNLSYLVLVWNLSTNSCLDLLNVRVLRWQCSALLHCSYVQHAALHIALALPAMVAIFTSTNPFCCGVLQWTQLGMIASNLNPLLVPKFFIFPRVVHSDLFNF
jgi:hypothetical protein